ncbi:helix-turn-helix transcriptional regulator [Streptomyces sp. NPDC094034]|uniref:helix-turn-helix domain-containing protein n=1 Tax=Streptomyces sp. NPDC094034 TaxID=3155309 RepID=UPI00331C22B5
MDSPMDSSAELRDFLRASRARLRPEDVGLAPPRYSDPARSRRVPGLRREEVAQLAGVSVDYYARLEQGRTRQVSEAVLSAVADTLRMNVTEREYFFSLVARQTRSTARTTERPTEQRVRPVIHRMLAQFGSPAQVLGRGLTVLAANQLARAVFFDPAEFPVKDRNLAKWLFLHPRAKELHLDWRQHALDYAAVLRADVGSHPEDPALNELIGELAVKSAEFREIWSAHQVSACLSGHMRLRHEDVGRIDLDYEALDVHGGQDHKLVVYTAAEGSPSAEALALLASWTAGPGRTPQRAGQRAAWERSGTPGTPGTAGTREDAATPGPREAAPRHREP